jgi:dihydrofolate reductase
MSRLVYSAIASLDGYVVDADGSFAWAAPDQELHAAVNEAERPHGTYLYGRRMYEVLAVWETLKSDEPVIRDYAQIWRDADKVVYSSTLDRVTTARTRLERRFDPAEVRRLVDAADRDVSVGGPTLAGHALRAGIVDQLHLYLHPVVVGGGTPALPEGVRLDLRLRSERRFGSGAVHLAYDVRRARRAAGPPG